MSASRIARTICISPLILLCVVVAAPLAFVAWVGECADFGFFWIQHRIAYPLHMWRRHGATP